MHYVTSTIKRPLVDFDHKVALTYPSKGNRSSYFEPHIEWLIDLQDPSQFSFRFQGRAPDKEVAMFTFEDENIAFQFKMKFG